MMKTIGALTTRATTYPGFVNVSTDDDGSVVVTVRGDPTTRDGVYVCGFKGKDDLDPQRCVPGNQRCNNYCNMAPEIGPMSDAPLRTSVVQVGATSSVRLTKDEWDLLKASVAA